MVLVYVNFASQNLLYRRDKVLLRNTLSLRRDISLLRNEISLRARIQIC